MFNLRDITNSLLKHVSQSMFDTLRTQEAFYTPLIMGQQKIAYERQDRHRTLEYVNNVTTGL